MIAVSFHRVSDEKSPAYPPIPVKVFEKVISYLNKKYHIVSIYDIEKVNPTNKIRLVLTFDDAFYDFKENALPILIKYNLPSVLNGISSCLDTGETFWTQKLNKIIEWYFFNKKEIYHPLLGSERILLNSKTVEKTGISIYKKLLPLEESNRDLIISDLARKYHINIEQKMLTWQELRYCESNRVVIGNHTMNHVNLTTLSEEELNSELFLSGEKFKHNTGKTPSIIAFPNGQYNNNVIEKSELFNYKYLLTTENKSFRIVGQDPKTSLVIPRIDLHSQTVWKNILRLKLYANNVKVITDYIPQNQIHHFCLNCNSKNLINLNGYEKDYLVKCKDCGFVFSQKIPTQKELIKYYEDTYTRDDYLSPITIKRYHEVLDVLEKYRRTNRLLDIGSGIGYFLKEAKQRGWEVYGTEFTDDAMAICKTIGATMHQGPLDSKNYKPEMFDVITSFEVIEHINNPKGELPIYYHILRKGGVVYFTTPNFNSIERLILKGQYSAIKYPEHLSYYTKKTIDQLFRNNHFNKLNLETTGFSLSRVLHSLKSSETFKVSETYNDEKIRQNFEKNYLLKFSKELINRILDTFKIGNSLKGLYQK